MKERFGAKKAKSMMLRVHTQTAGSMLTAQQPNNNIVRVALQTAAAVMGGTQSSIPTPKTKLSHFLLLNP